MEWNGMESWNHGIMESWNHGIMESWNHGIMDKLAAQPPRTHILSLRLLLQQQHSTV